MKIPKRSNIELRWVGGASHFCRWNGRKKRLPRSKIPSAKLRVADSINAAGSATAEQPAKFNHLQLLAAATGNRAEIL
jgi:hypothetical protein